MGVLLLLEPGSCAGHAAVGCSLVAMLGPTAMAQPRESPGAVPGPALAAGELRGHTGPGSSSPAAQNSTLGLMVVPGICTGPDGGAAQG